MAGHSYTAARHVSKVVICQPDDIRSHYRPDRPGRRQRPRGQHRLLPSQAKVRSRSGLLAEVRHRAIHLP
jgi:hypothetical protein